MRFPSLALSGLLLSTTLPALAQTTPAETPAAPRFFVGLGAYSSYYQPFEGRPAGIRGFPVPLQLTAGYQLRPRLAVQVGLAYQGSAAAYDGSGYYYNPGSARGVYYSYEGNSTVRTASVSALARYTLTRKPGHRLQFDALGGFALEHRRGTNRGTYLDSLNGSRDVRSYDTRGSNNNLLLTAGLGTRFRLSPRFELTSDFTVNKSLSGYGYQRGLTSSQALGLRYRFGRR